MPISCLQLRRPLAPPPSASALCACGSVGREEVGSSGTSVIIECPAAAPGWALARRCSWMDPRTARLVESSDAWDHYSVRTCHGTRSVALLDGSGWIPSECEDSPPSFFRSYNDGPVVSQACHHEEHVRGETRHCPRWRLLTAATLTYGHTYTSYARCAASHSSVSYRSMARRSSRSYTATPTLG